MDDNAIKVDNLSKDFKLPHEKTSSIKSAFVNFYKRNKSYEYQKALKDVSFEIKQGEFFGIVGRNGSGKSTLLKTLAGIYVPTKGSVALNGKLTPFIELGVGFNPELTGRENVYLNGAILGFNRREMKAMYKDIVEFAEIERFMDQKLKNYSSGMQVRLAFAIAIRARSDILLIDEVLAVGDAAFQRKCYNYFEELKREKKTVVFVSHDMNAVRRFCNRAALISQGVLSLVGSPEQVAELYEKQNASNQSINNNDADISEGAIIKKLSFGDSMSSFRLKDTITVLFNIKTSRNIKVAPGINITRADGHFIAGVSSHAQAKLKEVASGETVSFKVSFPAKRFTKGTYFIDGVVYDGSNPQPVYYGSSMLKFKISEDDQSWGSFNLDGTWESI